LSEIAESESRSSEFLLSLERSSSNKGEYMRELNIMFACDVANSTMDDELLGHLAAYKELHERDKEMAECALHLAVERAKQLEYVEELPNNVIFVDFVAKRRVA
jgi:hypothetical protein